ncbi:apolipoprotein D-like [Arctopsyche grandis]|uniref:apolipoprotein D-like n=1 Tax=Arctopsyche grandis TaxID=121162 RepID=UPI00406D9832
MSFCTGARILLAVLIFNTFLISAMCSGFGKCPKMTPMRNFDTTKFSGQWFEVERSFYLLEIVSSCTYLNFTENSKGNFDIAASSINRWSEKKIFAFGLAIPMLDNSSIFRYKVKTNLPFSIARFLPGAGIYNILHTDYENYAILWYCSNILFAYTDRILIFGRARHISEDMRIEVYERLKSLKLDPDRLMVSKNVKCL